MIWLKGLQTDSSFQCKSSSHTNSVIPNAAAAGPSPKFGTVIITTGILTQLEDNELESVIGHEISH
jgi:Zn-dependent protease with chaperone function